MADDSNLDYGNGDSVDYIYDKKGRLKAEVYEDGNSVTYQYDNSGNLAVAKDTETGTVTTYYYDLSDRLSRYIRGTYSYSQYHDTYYEYDDREPYKFADAQTAQNLLPWNVPAEYCMK